MRADRFNLPLRIVMENPVPGVAILLYSGGPHDGQLHGPVSASKTALVFEFEVTVDGEVKGGGPRLLGPYTQGPPLARFTYLNIGGRAGQAGTQWNGRVKTPLFGITWAGIDSLAPHQRLTGHIAGRDRKGRPNCASVPILSPGWVPA